MAYKRGPNYKVFITTENLDSAINCTGDAPTAVAASGVIGINGTTKGIGNLGMITSANTSNSTTSEIKNIEAIDPTFTWVDEPVTIFGTSRDMDNPIRQKWEVNITRLRGGDAFALLLDGARFGVTGSGAGRALYDGSSAMPNSTGYRVYIWDGTYFAVGFNGTIANDSSKDTLTPTGITRESIHIMGGRWSASIPAADVCLTATQNITQT